MDHSQNVNRDQQFHSTERDNSDILLLAACLRQKEGQKKIFEERVAKHDRIKAEVSDIQNKLDNLQRTIEDKKSLHQQSYEDANQELEATSSKYNQILRTVDELEQDNHELESCIRSQTSKESQMTEKINKLDMSKKKTLESNNNLWDKINNEKVIHAVLPRVKHYLRYI